MNAKLSIVQPISYEGLKTGNYASIDERLDESLDGGEILVINAKETPYEPMSLAQLIISEGESSSAGYKEIVNQYFYVFDTVEKRGKGYYYHHITLCEVTRILMGISVDGMRITQPITGNKKTLYNVLEKIIGNYTLFMTGEWNPLQISISDGDIETLLNNTESPEFSWSAGTLLWEVLCDIGNVINAIPRAYYDSHGISDNKISITFDPVNKSETETEL